MMILNPLQSSSALVFPDSHLKKRTARGATLDVRVAQGERIPGLSRRQRRQLRRVLLSKARHAARTGIVPRGCDKGPTFEGGRYVCCTPGKGEYQVEHPVQICVYF